MSFPQRDGQLDLPPFDGHGCSERYGSATFWRRSFVVPKPYPPEFRRRALDLLESGRSVREVATSWGIAEPCLHRWKWLDLSERGLKASGPAAVEQVVPSEAEFALVAALAAEGVLFKQACLSHRRGLL